MRIHEIAKQKGTTSKELIAQFKKIGIEAKSHMSVVSDEDLKKLEQSLSPASEKIPTKKEVQSKSKPSPFQAREKREPLKSKSTSAAKDKSSQKKSSTDKSLPATKKPETTKKTFSSPKKHAAPARQKFKPKKEEAFPEKIEEITISGGIPLFQVADMMGKQVGELVLSLLKTGMACNKNCVLSKETISSLAHQFGIKVNIKEDAEKQEEGKKVLAEGGAARWPVVVVMGHVDHGKTTLLDYIRKMNTAKQEKGGITQKLSAYEVVTNHGKVSFLDTPGHEAFSYMRKKGAGVTDLAVLVVAVDDGIMPQTIEAIKHAKAAGVPLIAAINKIDKIEESMRVGEIEKIKRQLAQHDLLPEDWGGDLICVPISASTGEGVDELLEMVVLQSQIMELKSDPNGPASCFVLESKKDKGLGLVATTICTSGAIKVGDYFSCGADLGKVRLLINSFGERISSSGPSTPVQIVGFDGKGALGENLEVISAEEYLKIRSKGRRDIYSQPQKTTPLGALDGEKKSFPIIIKADSRGSQEAVSGQIKKLNKKFEKLSLYLNVVQEGIGDISSKDIDLALQIESNMIICLHCGVEKNAATLAREKSLEVKRFDVIYKLVEYLEEFLKSKIEAKIVLRKSGEATVRKVFDLKSRGVIAGCYVSDGTFARSNIVACMRGGEEVGRGKIISLQREKKDAKEVHSGFECGFITDSFHGWQIGDTVHCFKEEKQLPTI